MLVPRSKPITVALAAVLLFGLAIGGIVWYRSQATSHGSRTMPPPDPPHDLYGIEFVWVPAGTFTMGSSDGEPERFATEGPQHQVTFSHGFFLGKYGVTQAQWQAVMGNNPSGFKNCDRCPVEQVSWDDAQEFLKKLNALHNGFAYRLPTEAEWEYAARAGTTGAYAGNLAATAWFADNSRNATHPVGTKQANAWGLYDMLGNVWAWCQDWYGNYDGGAQTDPQGPSSGTGRVLRGGSWGSGALYLRSALRYSSVPSTRSDLIGFRIVAVQTSAKP